MPAVPLPNLAPLAPDDCPLLKKFGGADAERLLGQFNQAVEEVRVLGTDRLIGPKLGLPEPFGTVLAQLAETRELMTRAKYVVGFIGITQAGKSTTVNNVLGEEVCKAGAMDATSSQPCRIVKSARRYLEVEYLSRSRAAGRRQKLCEAIGLGTPGENREVLQLIKPPENYRRPEGKDLPRLQDDLKYLKDFLEALEAGRHLLTEPAGTKTDLPYGSRYDYTTHTKAAAGAELLLLREARFHIDNPQLPDDLELCDLPGLDSKRTVDDLVTWEYLPDLHGTFLFVNAGGNLMTEGMLRILDRIKTEFEHRLTGRAWVIFNKMDALSPDCFRTGGQDNIFGTIGRFLDRVGVPEAQVCFSSKKVWDAASSTAGRTADPGFAAQALCQSAANPVPETCPPGLRSAWQELLRDGGISHIRRLMTRDVAVSLAGQVRTDVGQKLGAFSQELTVLVAAERKRAKMNQADLQAAMTCYYKVLDTRVGLAVRTAEYPVLLQEAERLRRSLTRLFDQGARPEVLAHLSPEQLAHQFRAHARVLEQFLQGELAGELLEKVYEEVGQKLDGLPVVPVGATQQGCREAWRAFALEDRGDEGWLAPRPGFSSPELSDWLAHPTAEGVAGDLYVDLMHRKIDVAVRQTAQLLRSRLRLRLGQLFEELARLTGERGADAA